MESQHPPLWHEGMFLAPQHFQQAERHQRAMLRLALAAVRPFAWGMLRCEVDAQSLAAGDLMLSVAEGIMPDGTPFSAVEAGDLPASRPLGEAFTPGIERVEAWLALPSRVPGAAAASEDGLADGRWLRARRLLRLVGDEVHGGSARELALAAPNLRLLLGSEPRDGHVAIKVAELVRLGAGGFAVDPGWAPPSLRLGAAPALQACLRRICELVTGRATELALQRRARNQGLVEVSASELGLLLVLRALDARLPRLLHQLEAGVHHPEEVYLELASLCGELAAFSSEGSAKDLPAYRHEAPLGSFTALEERLRSMLQAVLPSRYLPLPLSGAGERVQACTVPERALGPRARLFLGVVSTLPAERVLKEIPARAKVASLGRLPAITSQAMPGLRLTYLATPPGELPLQPGGVYFELAKEGPEWVLAEKTRSLAIYLPPEYQQARAEFLAVVEG